MEGKEGLIGRLKGKYDLAGHPALSAHISKLEGLFKNLNDKYNAAKGRMARERSAENYLRSMWGHGCGLDELLFATFADTEALSAAKRRVGAWSKEGEIYDFYTAFSRHLQKGSGLGSSFARESPFEFFDEKTAKRCLNVLGSSMNRPVRYLWLSGILEKSPVSRSPLALSNAEISGLCLSAMINASEKIKKLVLDDASNVDYLGAFLRDGKEIIVKEATGHNFGYKKAEGSRTIARTLLDTTKPKKLTYILYKNLRKNIKSKFSYGYAILTAELIGLYETVGNNNFVQAFNSYLIQNHVIDRAQALTTPPLNLVFNYMTAGATVIIAATALASALSKSYKEYQAQKALLPQYYSKNKPAH